MTKFLIILFLIIGWIILFLLTLLFFMGATKNDKK